MNKNPKKYKGTLSELAAEHYAYEVLGCVRTVRAVATKFQRQDLFASDVLGRKPDGTLCAIQVTAGQASAVSARKRKLEREVWHSSDIVLLLQLYWEKGKGNKKDWFFKVWEYTCDNLSDKRAWFHKSDHAVSQSWFKLYRRSIYRLA